MSQVIEKRPALAVKPSPTSIALGYLVLVLVPLVLKLLGVGPVACWSWNKVTFTIWAPWLLTAVMSVLGWLVYLIQNRPGRG
jgi:hypothetical protein